MAQTITNEEYRQYSSSEVSLPKGSIVFAGGAASPWAYSVLFPSVVVLFVCLLIVVSTLFSLFNKFNVGLCILAGITILISVAIMQYMRTVLDARTRARVGDWKEGVLLLPEKLIAPDISILRTQIRDVKTEVRWGKPVWHAIIIFWDGGQWEMPRNVSGGRSDQKVATLLRWWRR